jgi:hypothetical protein
MACENTYKDNTLADALAAKDTAEAQVAVLRAFIERVSRADPEMMNVLWMQEDADQLLASLPDSAAKLRAVVEAAETIPSSNTASDIWSFVNRLRDAVVALQASRTGGEEQEDKP